MEIKYIVISLPRTGTRSICDMAKIVGLTQKHVSTKWQADLPTYDLFSDTPFFAPKVVEEIASDSRYDVRFIYLRRSAASWFASFQRIGLAENFQDFCESDPGLLSKSQQFDREYYIDALGNRPLNEDTARVAFARHQATVFEIACCFRRPLLEYAFSDGWKPFCDYVGRPIPGTPIPHVNRTSMFE